MSQDIPAMATKLESMAAGVRSAFARTGRRADADAAFELEEAAHHLRQADRRLGAMRAEQAALAAASGPKKRKASV